MPILTLGGVEGKMFKPMAATVPFALTGSLLIAMALMPVLTSYFFSRKKINEHTWPMRRLDRLYAPRFRAAAVDVAAGPCDTPPFPFPSDRQQPCPGALWRGSRVVSLILSGRTARYLKMSCGCLADPGNCSLAIGPDVGFGS